MVVCGGRGVTEPGVRDLRVPDPGVCDRRDQGVEGPEEERWAGRPRLPLSADCGPGDTVRGSGCESQTGGGVNREWG